METPLGTYALVTPRLDQTLYGRATFLRVSAPSFISTERSGRCPGMLKLFAIANDPWLKGISASRHGRRVRALPRTSLTVH